MNEYDSVVSRIAEIACKRISIYDCRFDKKAADDIFSSIMPDWYLDLYTVSTNNQLLESKGTMYEYLLKKFLNAHDKILGTNFKALVDDVKARRLIISPSNLFEINEEGWIVPEIAGPSVFNKNRVSLDNAYGCPKGTAFIVGDKFLTHFSLKVMIHLEDKNDPSSHEIFYKLVDPKTATPTAIIFLITLYILIILGITIFVIILWIKGNKKKALVNSDDNEMILDENDEFMDNIIVNDPRHQLQKTSFPDKSTDIYDSRLNDFRVSKGLASMSSKRNKNDKHSDKKMFTGRTDDN